MLTNLNQIHGRYTVISAGLGWKPRGKYLVATRGVRVAAIIETRDR